MMSTKVFLCHRCTHLWRNQSVSHVLRLCQRYSTQVDNCTMFSYSTRFMHTVFPKAVDKCYFVFLTSKTFSQSNCAALYSCWKTPLSHKANTSKVCLNDSVKEGTRMSHTRHQKSFLHLPMSFSSIKQPYFALCQDKQLLHHSRASILWPPLPSNNDTMTTVSSFSALKGSVRFYSSQICQGHMEQGDGKGREEGKQKINSSDCDDEIVSEDNNDNLPQKYQADMNEIESTGDLQEYEVIEGDETLVFPATHTHVEKVSDVTERRAVDKMTLPELSRTAVNIVPYVKRSETLQNLVRLGVSLADVQKEKEIAELLIKSNFDRDILPLIKFLTLVGVEANLIGYILTANPRLFKESVQDLEIRVGFLIQKKFTLQDIVTMITSAPLMLLMDPWMMDEKLAFLQQSFSLTDTEVREVVTRFAKLLPLRRDVIADVRFHLKEFIGFSNAELKQLILSDGKIFKTNTDFLVKTFDYLHNTMLIPHQQILAWPKILRMRRFVIQNRNLFLLSLGRAQYDPRKENYVSMQALAGVSDEEFCEKVAKCDVEKFYEFCKTL